MKTLIISLTAACAVIAGYFCVRFFTRRDLGFTPVTKYVRNLVENLLQTEPAAAPEVGTTPAMTTN